MESEFSLADEIFEGLEDIPEECDFFGAAADINGPTHAHKGFILELAHASMANADEAVTNPEAYSFFFGD